MTRSSVVSINQSYRKKLSLANALDYSLSRSAAPSLSHTLVTAEPAYYVQNCLLSSANYLNVIQFLKVLCLFDTFLLVLITSIWPID